ncbi:MAG: hypothetical protein ACMXYF_05315 [Candidatus Woesearchaeota archaeon]
MNKAMKTNGDKNTTKNGSANRLKILNYLFAYTTFFIGLIFGFIHFLNDRIATPNIENVIITTSLIIVIFILIAYWLFIIFALMIEFMNIFYNSENSKLGSQSIFELILYLIPSFAAIACIIILSGIFYILGNLIIAIIIVMLFLFLIILNSILLPKILRFVKKEMPIILVAFSIIIIIMLILFLIFLQAPSLLSTSEIITEQNFYYESETIRGVIESRGFFGILPTSYNITFNNGESIETNHLGNIITFMIPLPKYNITNATIKVEYYVEYGQFFLSKQTITKPIAIFPTDS